MQLGASEKDVEFTAVRAKLPGQFGVFQSGLVSQAQEKALRALNTHGIHHFATKGGHGTDLHQ